MATNENEWTPDWELVPPGVGFIALADNQKDEWSYHLFEFMRQEHDYGHSEETQLIEGDTGVVLRVEEWRLNTSDGRELPRLRILNVENGLILRVTGQGHPEEDEIQIWVRGAKVGLEKLGSRKNVNWLAILTQVEPSHSSGVSRLKENVESDDLSFALVGECIVEDRPTSSPNIGLHPRPFMHWPIVVRGQTSCYAWDEDGVLAAKQRLRVLTALLSLAWDEPWALREGPRDPALSFPAERKPIMGQSWQNISNGERQRLGRPRQVPHWLIGAEEVLGTTNRLKDALLMHHEGLLLLAGHPSISLVCFVSAIETIAQIMKKPERCPECKGVTSSRRRFDTAINEVLAADEAALLADAYSKKRSTTVHASRLHGNEIDIGGWGMVSTFVEDPSFKFTFGIVRAAKTAGARLLTRELNA